jgi:hypothetical protein
MENPPHCALPPWGKVLLKELRMLSMCSYFTEIIFLLFHCFRRYAFAAGTTDGPGMFGFVQGTTSGNPFWDKVRDALSTPTEAEIACQAPKPILLNTGSLLNYYIDFMFLIANLLLL